MQIGVDSFGAVISDPATGLTVSALQRMDRPGQRKTKSVVLIVTEKRAVPFG